MTQYLEGSYPGVFRLASGMEVPGQLTLAGPNTSFLAWSDKFSIYHGDFRSVNGELYDSRQVSLIDCQDQQIDEGILSHGGMYVSWADRSGKPTRTNYTIELDPSYVLFGEYYLSPNEAVVHRLHFVFEDIGALFYDERAIGYVAGKTGNAKIREVVKQIMLSGGVSREDTTAEMMGAEVNFGIARAKPFIDVQTMLGRLQAWRRLESDGDANHRTLRSEVIITLDFEGAHTLEYAIRRTRRIIEFFNLVSGRHQNLVWLKLETSKAESSLELYVYPEYERQSRLQARDVLLDGINRPDEFGEVLTNWLERERNELWRDVRTRLATHTQERSRFSVDRLVGLSNIFDVLPSAEYPPANRSEDIKRAIEGCKEAFSEMAPDSMERAMNALGRIHQHTLRDKALYRTEILTRRIGDRIPQISMVIAEAIKSRNFYVHGSGTDPGPDTARFLADTLEFVFAGSDLVEVGWDIRHWCDTCLPSSHPFSAYLGSYTDRLEQMKKGGR